MPRDPLSSTERDALAKSIEQFIKIDNEKRCEEARIYQIAALVNILDAVHQANFTQDKIKAYTHKIGGDTYHVSDSPCCSAPNPIHEGSFYDLGISLVVAAGNCKLRLSGDDDFVNFTPSLRYCPLFIESYNNQCKISSWMSSEVWTSIETLWADQFKLFRAEYSALAAELRPNGETLAAAHTKKIAANRARAARPDQVAKREQEARARAQASLSSLLTVSCSSVLDKWTPEELLSYLRLCQTHGYVLRELMTWSGKTPLGSKVLELEDVVTAIEMAKVSSVMSS